MAHFSTAMLEPLERSCSGWLACIVGARLLDGYAALA